MSSLHKSKRSIFFFLTTLTLSTVLFAAERQAPSTYPTYPALTHATDASNLTIQRGEYLIKMGDCISCHTDTKHDGAPFAGGLSMKTPFGTFYTPNITPDKDTGIGEWTEHDFTRALKEGMGPHDKNFFAGFPFVYFANVTDEVAKDMYAYLMNIPSVYSPNKPLPFPFSLPGSRLAFF